MTLTKSQRRKLAKAARELAMEFAEGRGPELNPYSFCGCAAGETVRRAGIKDNDVGDFANWMEWDAFSLARPLSGGTFHARHHDDPGAVVFPLLWLADELEAQ